MKLTHMKFHLTVVFAILSTSLMAQQIKWKRLYKNDYNLMSMIDVPILVWDEKIIADYPNHLPPSIQKIVYYPFNLILDKTHEIEDTLAFEVRLFFATDLSTGFMIKDEDQNKVLLQVLDETELELVIDKEQVPFWKFKFAIPLDHQYHWFRLILNPIASDAPELAPQEILFRIRENVLDPWPLAPFKDFLYPEYVPNEIVPYIKKGNR